MQGTRLVDRVRLGSGAGGALATQILERDRRERQIRAAGPFPASDNRPDRAGRRAISLQIRPLGSGIALHESLMAQTGSGEASSACPLLGRSGHGAAALAYRPVADDPELT